MSAQRRGIGLVVVVCLSLVATACLPAVAATLGSETPDPTVQDRAGKAGPPLRDLVGATEPPLHEQVETDRIRMIVSVQEDGDARWTIEYRTDLDDQNTTEAFQSLQEDVRANPQTYLDQFRARILGTVRSAENATGRPMNASDFRVDTEIRLGRTGVVSYTYLWSNFSQRRGDRLLVGDAIAGLFLERKLTLQVQWPEGWTTADVAPAPDSSPGRSVLWRGTDTDFGPEQPRVVLERGTPTETATQTETATPTQTATSQGTATASPTTGRESGDGTPTTGGETTTGAGSEGGPDESGGFPVVALAALALVAVAVAVAWFRRPEEVTDATTADRGPTGDGVTEDESDDEAGGAAKEETDGEPPQAADDAPEASDEADSEDDQPPIDEELLSNEERVLRLLEERGGRIKQQEVVDALDWTEAKTSQVVSGMRDDGDIDTFRLGRENVLTLPEETIDPTAEDDDGQQGDT